MSTAWHNIIKKQTAAWEALTILAKFYPWRISGEMRIRMKYGRLRERFPNGAFGFSEALELTCYKKNGPVVGS